MKKIFKLMLGLMVSMSLLTSCGKDGDEIEKILDSFMSMKDYIALFESGVKKTHEYKLDKQTKQITYTDVVKINNIWVYTMEIVADFEEGRNAASGEYALVCSRATSKTSYACIEAAKQEYESWKEDGDDYFKGLNLDKGTISYDVTDEFKGMDYDTVAMLLEEMMRIDE